MSAPLVPTLGGVSPLPSGWNTTAAELYERVTDALLSEDPSSVLTVQLAPVGPVRVSGKHELYGARGFWEKATGTNGSWEAQTYREFLRRIDSSTTYVGFGTWIGPTILFAAQLASRAFGVEADPSAFAQVRMNVKLNANAPWARRIVLQPACVAAAGDEGMHKMSSSAAGNSCSGIGAVAGCGGRRGVHWSVLCYSLPQLFEHWGLVPGPHVFIKVDVESYECKLLPTLAPWFARANLTLKPTIYASMHHQIRKCAVDEYHAIADLADSYQFAYCTKGREKRHFVKGSKALPCTDGELTLSDVD